MVLVMVAHGWAAGGFQRPTRMPMLRCLTVAFLTEPFKVSDEHPTARGPRVRARVGSAVQLIPCMLLQ